MSGRTLFWVVSAGLISFFLWIIFTVGTSPVTDQERRARQAPSAEEVRQAYLTRRERRKARRDEEEEEEDATPVVVYEESAPPVGYSPAPQQVERHSAYNDDVWRASPRREQEPARDVQYQAQPDPYMAPRRNSQYEDDFEAPPQSQARITDSQGMDSIHSIQVAPDRTWNYKTGEYQWADKQADGTLRERDE